MAAPTTPVISLARLSDTSLSVTINGDPGVINRTYYRRPGLDAADQTGPTVTGNGVVSLTSLAPSSTYQVTVVSDNGTYSLPAFGYVSLLSVSSVLSAVLSRWNSSPTLLAAAGPLFSSEVPETIDGSDVAVPYACVRVDKSFFEWTTEQRYLECTNVDFWLFCVGLAPTEQAASLARQTFDWQSLPFVAPDATAYTRPASWQVKSTGVRYKQGQFVYVADLGYECCVNRTLTA